MTDLFSSCLPALSAIPMTVEGGGGGSWNGWVGSRQLLVLVLSFSTLLTCIPDRAWKLGKQKRQHQGETEEAKEHTKVWNTNTSCKRQTLRWTQTLTQKPLSICFLGHRPGALLQDVPTGWRQMTSNSESAHLGSVWESRVLNIISGSFAYQLCDLGEVLNLSCTSVSITAIITTTFPDMRYNNNNNF